MATAEETRLEPLVKGWLSALRQAERARKEFQDDADECLNFFCKNSEWLWDEKNPRKFWSGRVAPKFKMTVNKAFEMVALFGPLMYHDNPVRTVTPRKAMQFPPDLYGITPEFQQFQQAQEQFGQAQQQYQQMMMDGPPPQEPGMPPAVPPPPPVPPIPPPSLQDPLMMQQQQQLFAQYQADQQAQQQEAMQDEFRAMLMSAYLNYLPNEMPGGGLRLHSQKAVNEALLTGRGCLWTAPDTMPGSDTRIIVSEYDSVANLLIDPDAHSLEDAMWIARRCIKPYWMVEDQCGVERGTFKDCCKLETATSEGLSAGDANAQDERQRGQTNDLMSYYEIYSKMGCGARLSGVDSKIVDESGALESVFGDYCYMLIADGVKYPLNLNPASITPDQDVTQALAWPVPYYADQRWPVTCLDFYCEPNKAWPISPLAPGLGWLKFINVMMSALANKIWMTQRTFIGVLKGAAKELRETIEKGRDLEIIDIESTLNAPLDRIVQFLQAPNVQSDVWQIMTAAMDEFKRVTGMNDLLYGLNPGNTQSRSAQDAQNKQQGVNIRPDYMAKQVEAWATEVARKEAMCARWFIEAQDVAPVLGPQAASVWQSLVLDQDVAKVVREMEYRVEANTARKPNKDRQVANANQAIGQLFPPLFQYAMQTGNVQPANAILGQFAEAMDWEGSPLQIQPPPPPPPPMPPPQGPPEKSEKEPQHA